MAGYDDTVISEAVHRFVLDEGSGDVEGKEFTRRTVFVSEPMKAEELLAVMADELRKLLIHKAKNLAEGSRLRIVVSIAGLDEIEKEKTSEAPVETVEAAALLSEIQAEKMDKARVEVQAEKMDGENETGKEAAGDGVLPCF